MDGFQTSFAAELKKLYNASRISSYRDLATKSGVPPATISEWFTGKFRRTPDWEKVKAIVKACVAHAPDDPEVLRLGDVDWWRREHGRLQSNLDRLPQRPRHPRTRPTDPVIGQWTPEQLGVHRVVAIDGTDADHAPLTGYLLRTHDERLRQALREGCRFVVLTGSTCTGKTRAAFEAVRAELPELPLLRPFSPDQLLLRASAGDLEHRGVLWLNELHSYLNHAAGPQVVDALAAAVNHPGGVVVVGTTQTAKWDSVMDDGCQHDAVRQFLISVRHIEVPESFVDDADSRARLQAASRDDPRFAYAVEAAANGRVIQALTGGPALLAMLAKPTNAVANALVEAAIDGAVLCGTPEVSEAFLRRAAPGYLTAAQRAAADTWFDDAIMTATKPVKGISALTPLRLAPDPGTPDAFQPHDFLAHHHDTEHARVPATTWSALVDHAPESEARLGLAESAKQRGLYQTAALALLPTVNARAGAEAMSHLLNRDEEWLRFAAERGSEHSIWRMAWRAGESGDRDGAASWWRRHLELTHGYAMSDQVGTLAELGLLDDAVDWLHPAADAGNRIALFATYDLLCWANRHGEAIRTLDGLAIGGDRDAQLRVAWAYADMGDQSEAVRRMTAIAETGDTYAMHWLADAGADAELWTRRAADRGSKWAIRKLASDEDPVASAKLWLNRDIFRASSLYAAGGELAKALALWKPGAEAGDRFSMRMLGELLAQAGERGTAESWLRKAAEEEVAVNVIALAEFLAQESRYTEAAGLVTDAAERGEAWAIDSYVKTLTTAGKRSDAIEWLTDHAVRGSVHCMRQLGEILDSAEWRERAARASGSARSIRRIAREYRDCGRLAEAIELLRPSAAHDSRSTGMLVNILEEMGELDEAEQRLRDSLERGIVAMSALEHFLSSHGREAEAAQLERYGIDVGGQTAEPWQVSPPS
ncbi:hypothetical protein [Amycolatopsis sp. WQ 127309]|uniref:hypothetical protein n=1 Tax=Amycolatopsis sp. WQ 127309 TaxID=2932773 RepID=UPI001FF1446B|nr:hypothetical protein [Amycolatopsis sp. WQ 127309]UOZ03506.1 hypothetical protein MUY22_32215 [Amycolatopsis sp. WQ 127309]